MAAPSSTSMIWKLLLQVMLAAWLVRAADEDPLQDFCVADYTNTRTSLNGFPCKPAERVQSSDFKSSLLQSEGPFEENLGLAINLATAARVPGLNTMGLGLGRVSIRPRGVNPPHVHPRANELFYLAQGTLVVGLVTTNNTYFQETLQVGDFFVFPRGLLHFQLNPHQDQPALAFAFFNSQNPGVLRLAAATFASKPPLPDEVLQTAFAIDQEEVDHLRERVATTLLVSDSGAQPSCSSYEEPLLRADLLHCLNKHSAQHASM